MLFLSAFALIDSDSFWVRQGSRFRVSPLVFQFTPLVAFTFVAVVCLRFLRFAFCFI